MGIHLAMLIGYERVNVATGRGRVDPSRRPGGSQIPGALFGIGVAAFVDETVFHQLLHWHHFYDKSTTDIGLVSDGLFHAFGWFAVVAGLFWLASLRARSVLDWRQWAGGALLGAGAFQLYDGTVQHKLMRLHQIRYEVDITRYDVTWNVLAATMIVLGFVIMIADRRGRVRSS